MKTIVLLGSAFLAAGLVAPHSDAASCKDNRDFYQSLPTVIGREDQQGKFPYVLNCDTVFVRKGVTATVHPGTLIHFSKPTLNSVIKVEGTLILKGTKNSYVSLSGNLDTTKGRQEPGDKNWGGIEVGEDGRLEIEYAGFHGAPTPITAFSKKVKIVNSWFKGSSGIILPDGTLYSMESKWHPINSLDLAEKKAERKPMRVGGDRPAEAISESEKAALLAKGSNGYWTWPKVAGGAAVLVALGVGGYYLVPNSGGSGSDGKADTPDPRNPFSNAEDLLKVLPKD